MADSVEETEQTPCGSFRQRGPTIVNKLVDLFDLFDFDMITFNNVLSVYPNPPQHPTKDHSMKNAREKGVKRWLQVDFHIKKKARDRALIDYRYKPTTYGA